MTAASIRERIALNAAAVTALNERIAIDVRALARNQAALWRQVPALALASMGHETGPSPESLTGNGLWRLETGLAHTLNGDVYINAFNGTLVFANRNPIDDATAVHLAKRLDLLDAAAVIQKLQAAAARPYQQGIDLTAMKSRRDDLRRRLGIPKGTIIPTLIVPVR